MPEEIRPEVIQKTQKVLGRFVKKPPLTDKLLRKPPFRFLHDIVNSVIRESGFLKGLFADEELVSENVKERDAKIAFLAKLVDAVKTITTIDLKARPGKIVAGLEPTETNLLLQAIGRALEKNLDSSDYVKQVQSGNVKPTVEKKRIRKDPANDGKQKSTKTIVTNREEKEKTKVVSNEKRSKGSLDTPKSTDRSRTKRQSKTDEKEQNKEENHKRKEKVSSDKQKTVERKGSIESVRRAKDADKKEKHVKSLKENVQELEEVLNVKETREIPQVVSKENAETKTVNSNAITEAEAVHIKEEPIKPAIAITNEDEQEVVANKKRAPSASRPKSARPKSGELKERKPPSAAASSSNDAELPVQISSSSSSVRPRSSLRPPSVRPSSARPGAPRLRPDSALPMKEVVTLGKINVIVENFDSKDADEEETVVIRDNAEMAEASEGLAEVPENNKGHLVEQILEQINSEKEEGDDTTRRKVDIDWEDSVQGKETTSKETTNLRTLIQTLTKTANPLGKLLNYLHEDLEAMHGELELWTNAKRQMFAEIGKQKKTSAELSKPLLTQLENLNGEIKKIEGEIVSARSNILRNEVKIEELFSK